MERKTKSIKDVNKMRRLINKKRSTDNYLRKAKLLLLLRLQAGADSIIIL